MTTLPPDPDRSRQLRAARFVALEWVRDSVTRKGAKSCMFVANRDGWDDAGGANAEIAATASGATHIGNVKRCASPWSCPVCAPTIASRRADEIDECVVEWLRTGGRVFFVTATLSHKLGDDLDKLLTMLQASWSRTWRWAAPYYSKVTGELTNPGKIRPDWYGGQVRTVEITHGLNGWHPHVHSLVFVPAGVDLDDAAVIGRLKAHGDRWEESVTRLGGKTDVRSAAAPGWDVRQVHTASDMANYLTKVDGGWSNWSAGREIAKADQKRKGITPWMLLADAVAGDVGAAKLFKVYERATRGLRRIVASPGLLDLVDDEDAAVEQLDDEPVVVVQVGTHEWKKLLRTRRAASLISDVADLATGHTDEWLWPDSWLVLRPPPLALSG